MLDTKALAEATAAIVKQHVEAATAPLLAHNAALSEQNKALDERLAALEAREPLRGEPGKDAEPYEPDPEHIKSMLVEIAEPVLKAIPTPKDGESVTLEDVRPLIEEWLAKAVADLPVAKDGDPGKDGAGIADLVIDREGSLVATFTDGRMKNLGRVVGRDGENGTPGENGRDGFSLEHFDTKWDGERTLTLIFDDGQSEYTHQLQMPIMIDRGVWAERSYSQGDAVTWGGSLWIAQRDTEAKPDSPDSGWRLAVKRGRDGKDAK